METEAAEIQFPSEKFACYAFGLRDCCQNISSCFGVMPTGCPTSNVFTSGHGLLSPDLTKLWIHH